MRNSFYSKLFQNGVIASQDDIKTLALWGKPDATKDEIRQVRIPLSNF